MSARGKWIGGGLVVVALAGAGRLATNEVQLANAEARARGLEQRAGNATQDLRRLVRLEQELADQREAAADLEARRQAAEEQVAALTSSIEARQAELQELRAKAQSELKQVRAEAQADAERMHAALGEMEQLLVKREQALSEQRRLAQERARALQAAQALAADRAQELQAARERAEARESELARRQTELERQTATLRRKAQQIDELRGDLTQTRRQAERSGEVLDRLKTAGVNVARLSGERPMPHINAVVVGVDTEAVPPTLLLDVGRASGIEVKDRLYLIRDDAVVATLEVTEVAPQVSSARVVEGQRGLKLRPGEDVSSVRPSFSPP